MPERIPRFESGGQALDVGCGNGAFLSYLVALGWTCTGVDVSADAARTARATTSARVLVGDLTDVELEAGSFDVIFFNHSIEHIPRPRESLLRAHDLLRPGGRLYVETPNFAGSHARRERSYWLHLDTPRHLQLFTADTLDRLLREVGLEPTSAGSKDFLDARRWSRTFRAEERTGGMLPERPLPPRVILDLGLRLVDRGRLVARPLSGEIIWAWARRA
jgi:SAM-dependent methyltransferase